MAMLIAWHTLNAVRQPGSKKYTKGFLVVAPGITIRDRLQVLQPNDPNSYYASREIVPEDMLRELGQAKIVITNFHGVQEKGRDEPQQGAAGCAGHRRSNPKATGRCCAAWRDL